MGVAGVKGSNGCGADADGTAAVVLWEGTCIVCRSTKPGNQREHVRAFLSGWACHVGMAADAGPAADPTAGQSPPDKAGVFNQPRWW